tara:strand:- start:19863 stop:22064 length:2202 start_codon:yes stop_codon:yes gene_type:complete
MRLILKKGYPILKGDGNHGVHPVTGQPFYYGNPPPEFFHSEENPLNRNGFDRPLFSHYGELGIPQGQFGPGEFGEAVFTDEFGVQHRHGIDGVIFKVGMKLREAGLGNVNAAEVVQEAIERFNEDHKNTEDHNLPDVDSDEWRKLRSMDFQHSRSISEASNTKVRDTEKTLGTIYTNSGRGSHPSLGRFHESYAIPFAPYLASIMSRDLGIQVGRYDEGLSVGHISAGALSLNPETGMAVGRRKRGAQSGQVIGPNGEVSDNFLNTMGSDGGVAVDNLHSHEMLHHMPDGLYGVGKGGRPPNYERFMSTLMGLDLSKIPKELLDEAVVTNPKTGEPITLRETLSQSTFADILLRQLYQTPGAFHLMMGDTSQGIPEKLLTDIRTAAKEQNLLPEGVSLDDMRTHIKAGPVRNAYQQRRGKNSHKDAAELFAYAQLLGESENFPGVSALRDVNWPDIKLHPNVENQRRITELVAAALSHHYDHTPNRSLLDETPTGPNTGRMSAGFPTAPMNMELPQHLDQYHLKEMAGVPIAEAQGQQISPQFARVKRPIGEILQPTTPTQTPVSTPPITPSEEYRQAQEAFRYATPEQVRRVYVARSGLGQPGRAPAPTGPITPQEQRFQQTLSDPYQQTLDQYLRGDTAPVEDRLIKAMENLQYKDAANDDDVRKHLPSTRLSASSEDDLSFMAERMSITKHDVRAIIFSKGDWHRVAKTFNMSPVIVKAVKVAFGGGADE